jgi:DNA (cytosine-5)-methyltransferase 1
MSRANAIREIIVDNFCGGGGASTGIALAIGRSVDIAINHDPASIAMHKANHPETEHYCESVWEVDPRKAANGRPVALVWLSPDCKHFSKAKGGKPVTKNIRGLAWVAVRWAATVRPRVIMLENVEEFKTWGPLLIDGKPDPKQKGRTFQAFINALKRQGYQVEHKELRACDYGAPTIRKRFFLIARCDDQPIVWPKQTHGDPSSLEVKAGKLKPWRTAAEIIDWSKPCPSIFDTTEEIKRKYGIKAVRPLADNTMRRIARGIQKFVMENPQPFIVRVNHSGSNHHYCNSIDDPLLTITSKNGWGIVAPTLIQYHSETANHEARGQTLDKPIMTLDTSPRYGLVTSFLTKFYGTNTGQEVTEPLQTITAGGNHFGEVRAFLMQYYGASVGQEVTNPLFTVTTKDRFGLITVHGQDYQIADIGMRMLEPRELFNAQGFPPDYIIDVDSEGKRYPRSAQVARCGNAVPPPFAEHLVRANLPELCGTKSLREVGAK